VSIIALMMEAVSISETSEEMEWKGTVRIRSKCINEDNVRVETEAFLQAAMLQIVVLDSTETAFFTNISPAFRRLFQMLPEVIGNEGAFYVK
jgi:hypothetical protein